MLVSQGARAEAGVERLVELKDVEGRRKRRRLAKIERVFILAIGEAAGTIICHIQTIDIPTQSKMKSKGQDSVSVMWNLGITIAEPRRLWASAHKVP